MGKVKVLFSRRRLPGSLGIRLVTWSQWSHVEILDGDELIGANMGAGVSRTPLLERLEVSSRVAVVEFPCADPAAVIAAARSQLGKGYDYYGLLGILARRRNWHSTEDWFCSELVAWAFAEAGNPLFRVELGSRIVPQHLWMLHAPYVQPASPMALLDLLWPETLPA